MFNGRETQYSDEIIRSTGFWGDITVADFQQQRGIPLQVPVELVKASLVYAMQSIELDLAEVEQAYLQQAVSSAADIAGTKINGENHVQTLYKKAVFARAKHDLLPEFATLSARELHEKRDVIAEQKQLLAEATMAIRALKGKRRGGVHLL
ncbi:head completion/stabilization protein [Glaesserella parasuis]|uniref:head completion/stabilization protein n=1 Tax=Glaesserella parasuis TaxID=738 RepID=UPI0021BD152C|nr:head completion/stabilization protein [Glaesserella parasuis]MCT8824371.1 head completion/stabilization protein [Glaesserella parasuis]MCT8830285.1 head completion/stabilization protein [Glaesserella parasuis]MCT8834560.1 head completion/stabilization protein [Glaesserella parasuis]MDG6450319.1 head completion/stabilization protein [Glaesserella parasuis]MDO9656545.1 head completion/stabilization protein [Glaesserella parasuis]